MYGQHDQQQHLFQQQQRQQQLQQQQMQQQQQQQMQQPSMGCGNSFGGMQQSSNNSFGGGMGANNSFGGGAGGMGGRGMPGLGGGMPGGGSGLGLGGAAPHNSGLGGAGRLGGGGGSFGNMQGQPASYNPSGEILAMINKGQQNLSSLGLPPNQSALGMGGSMGGSLPVGLTPPGMPSVQGGAPGGLGGLGLPGQPDMGAPMGGIPSTPSFDMSDFPSLGQRAPSAPPGGMQQFRSGLQQGLGGGLGMSMPGVPQQALPPQSEFAIQNEDFPALPGAGPAPTGGGGHDGGLGGGGLGGGFGMEGGVSAMLGGLGKDEHGGLGGLGAGGGGTSVLLDGTTDRYGLMGLLNVIRMTDQDLNTLALGTDLTTLGLNLNSSECLYATFASPWADAPAQRDPEFSLPQCYYMQPPALKTGHFSKFQLETLFYIFYNMPRDTLQAYAATELYNRDWRYHKDLKLWFTKASRQGGAADTQKGQYIYFDINEWKKKMFHGAAGGAAAGGGGGTDVEGESAAGIEDL
jgi:CCR4-NOT transcription complex subunit 2